MNRETGHPKKEKNKKQPWTAQRIAREVWEYVKMIVIVALVVFFLEQVLIINMRIPSESMENTILVGDQIFGNRLAYLRNDPRRYDIVVFYNPDDESEKFIKRIIGLPGETVNVRDGKVYINDSDKPLNDSFCPEPPLGDAGPFVVPEDCYFMMGDNRNYSNDSRFWEHPYVHRDKIIGKAVIRYWPLNRISIMG